MTYVDGFVFAVKKKNLKAYKKMASEAGKIWEKHGALGYFECIGDDLNIKMGGMKHLTFPQIIKLKKDENVWFSFIIYKSKAHRNVVNKKVMEVMEEYMKDKKEEKMPFDVKRMAVGGFKTLVQE